MTITEAPYDYIDGDSTVLVHPGDAVTVTDSSGVARTGVYSGWIGDDAIAVDGVELAPGDTIRLA